MLTFDIKRKINNLRDILVGKVPDPKAQVEQITIAMIYKFMDDMDTDGAEFGGRAFFVDEYEKYAWSNIMNPQVGGIERIIRYSEGMEAMQRNPHLPPLFREIFKNAYLPYRDSETLNLFLAEINEFKYDNSEDLGNAFEYLLSIMGSQGDAGQFRTPRHIIDMMVAIMRPKKNEKLLDPACGTAGFLISAYKYIVSQNKDEKGNDNLTTTDRANLTKNFVGYDISPDMVRLSRVNMYLHRFLNPQIYEKDTLTDKEVWQKQYFDVILANPPFMTPKGGINPHKLFRVQANRSEVLFVDYIVENLAPSGRAAIIVPEGIVFQTATAYTSLRKMLVDEGYLYGVISMPSGVFNPYSGVKTSILLIDKTIARQTDKVLFVKMESDGYNLGAQRRKLDIEGDIPEIVDLFHMFRKSILSKEVFLNDSGLATVTDKEKIKSNNYILVGDRYKVAKTYNTAYPMVKLGEVCEIINGQSPESQYYNENGEGLPFYQGKTEFTDLFVGKTLKYTSKITKIAEPFDILISVRAPVGPVNITNIKCCIGRGLAAIRSKENVSSHYIFHILNAMQDRIKGNGGSTFDSISKKDIEEIEIPLPPIDIQNKIVAETEEYQKIIDGAKQVVNNYRPIIEIDSKWEKVKLGEICDINPLKSEISNIDKSIEVSFVPMEKLQVFSTNIILDTTRKLEEVYNGYTYFKEGDVLLAKVTPCFENGKIGIAKGLENGIGFGSSELYVIRENDRIRNMWIWLNLISDDFRNDGVNNMSGSGGLKRLTKHYLSNYLIPVPSLEIQEQIVAKIEEEQKAVESCKKLIEIYEQKIKDKISSIWGE